MCCFRYGWWKNGAPLASQFNIVRPSRGAIRIRPLTSFDEGHYECRASNQYGTAVSRSTVLQRADIGQYPSSEPEEQTGLVEGQPHQIECKRVKCFPEPSFTWALAEKGSVDEHPIPVITTSRIQIDEQGVFILYTLLNLQQNYMVQSL